ncbi:hypothetical protein [Neobacillus sp. LXY-4]|uniref:hypothetical protein n=1 Tax=Neobacillus sp. LXY-4 TaxID=3379826 RepID=UPI003EE008C3
MKIIQPMLNAIRNNDFAAMYKYEDIMINLDELMMNHKRNTQYEGKIKAAMKERQDSLEFKRQDMFENLVVEVTTLGIFDAISAKEISKVINKIVQTNTIELEYNALKLQVIQMLLELNQREKNKEVVKLNKILPLLDLRNGALKQKKHPYESLLDKGYIKNYSEIL